MREDDVAYHRRRAEQHRKLSEGCPPDIVYFHDKLAALHKQRADALSSGQLAKDDELFIVKH